MTTSPNSARACCIATRDAASRPRARAARLVVFDVDNTLFDWVGAWARAFDAMLAALGPFAPVTRETWCDAFRRAHRAQGWTGGLNGLDGALDAVSVAPHAVDEARDAATRAFLREWVAGLVPYPGVRHAAQRLGREGDALAALTESDVEVTAWRVAALGLGDAVPVVYGCRRAGRALDLERAALATHSAGAPVPAFRYLPDGLAKPDPDALRYVIRELGAEPRRTVCVGDNLGKDAPMALAAGASACWAAYGARRLPAQAALLERVAHWSQAEVARERHADTQDLGAVRPLADLRDL